MKHPVSEVTIKCRIYDDNGEPMFKGDVTVPIGPNFKRDLEKAQLQMQNEMLSGLFNMGLVTVTKIPPPPPPPEPPMWGPNAQGFNDPAHVPDQAPVFPWTHRDKGK